MTSTEQSVDKGAGAAAPGHRRPLAILAAIVFLLHLAVTGGHFISPDEELLYRMAESMALSGRTDVLPLEADIATGRLYVPPMMTFATRPGADGERFYTQYLPLQAALAVPLVWTARLLENAFAPAFAAPLPSTMTTQYLAPLPRDEFARAAFRRGMVVMLFNPLVAAVSAVILARLGRLLTGSRRAGIIAAALWAFATMAWPHSRSYFTEPLAGLLGLLAVDAAIRWAISNGSAARKHAVMTGVWLGLANWTRVDSPFLTMGMTLGLGGVAVWRMLREESYGRGWQTVYLRDVLVAAGIAAAAWITLQGFNAWRYGADWTSGYREQSEGVQFTTPILVGLHGLLFSPGKGLFFFSPALVLGLWGWSRAPEHWRWLRRFVLVVYTPFFLAMAMWQNWDGGWCWGPRHVVQIHLPLMLGAVFLYAGHVPSMRWAVTGLVFLVGAGVQVYGSSQNPLDYYREYFQTFHNMEYHRVNLREAQASAIQREFALFERERDGSIGRQVHPGRFPAPMIDSIYLPQHTQWATYRQMWRFGYCDWYVWNALSSRRPPDSWSEAP